MLKWSVVEFDDGSCEVIPSSWIHNNKRSAYWPCGKASDVKAAIVHAKTPESTWKSSTVLRILGQSGMPDLLLLHIYGYFLFID